MAIYRIPYKIEGYAVVVADNEAEAERSFWQFTQAELGAIGVLEAQDPYRDFEAETKDRKKLEALLKEAAFADETVQQVRVRHHERATLHEMAEKERSDG